MNWAPTLYIAGDSLVHRLDARVKILLLLAYSVCLFLIGSWWGLLLCTVLFVLVVVISRIPAGPIFKTLIPLYFILACTLVFNAFTLDANGSTDAYGVATASAGWFAGASAVALGPVYFLPDGLARGCFYAWRIVLLAVVGLTVSYTTQSAALTRGFEFFIKPLRVLGIHTEDAAMIFTLALRFIPLSVEELQQVRQAQIARGAGFEAGSLWKRVSSWATVFIPLFVNLFKRAESLAAALDARCYGVCPQRTTLYSCTFAGRDWAVLVSGLAICAIAAALL